MWAFTHSGALKRSLRVDDQSLRGKRIKRHKREESKRQAGVNTVHRHAQALLWVCAYGKAAAQCPWFFTSSRRERNLRWARLQARPDSNDRLGVLQQYNVHKPVSVLWHLMHPLVRLFRSRWCICLRSVHEFCLTQQKRHDSFLLYMHTGCCSMSIVQKCWSPQ